MAQLAHATTDAAGARAHDPAPSLLATAWSLKDRCVAAWNSEPAQATQAARELALLMDQPCAQPLSDADTLELHALVDWAQGLASMVEGHLALGALPAFDRAADAFTRLGQMDHAAQTLVPKVAVLAMLGRYDDAIACGELAHRQFAASGNALGAAKVSLNLGVLNERRGGYALAVRHLREAGARFARLGDHKHSVAADIDMAKAMGSIGDFDEALRMLARARERSQRHDFPALQALVEEVVADILLSRGDYRAALSGYESARRSYERLSMPQQQAIVEKLLADTYLELRLLPEALALYDVVLARLQSLRVPDEQAWTLLQRGRAQAASGRIEQAGSSFDEARATFASQRNHVGEAAVCLAQAERLVASGRPTQATPWIEAAQRGYVNTGSTEGAMKARLLQAQVALPARVDEARRGFELVLVEARQRSMLAVQARCLTGLGRCAQAAGDIDYARDAYEAAIDLLEDQRRALPGDDLRQAFLGDRLEPYRLRLELALHAFAGTPTRVCGAQVLAQLERVRARTLMDRVDTQPGDEAGAADDTGVRTLRDRVHWLARDAQRKHEAGEPLSAASEELHHAERDLLERVRRQRLHRAAADPADDARWDPAELVSALKSDEALIEYGFSGDELFACVVTQHGVDVHRRLATRAQVIDAVRATRFQIETLKHGAHALQEHMTRLAQRAQHRLAETHRLVFAPLAARLRDCRRLLIVPCGAIALLPFAALADEQGPIAKRFDLAMAPSARLALRGLQRAPVSQARPRVLAIGESSRLPQAAREAQFVAAIAGDGHALVGEAATLQAWRDNAPDADILHLACHAQFRDDNPVFSALHLHDGPLTVEALGSMRLRASLVVLSACDTGLGDIGDGDENVGLVRAFLVAGAGRVLASLWPVDDAVACVFMQAFYAALGRGAGPALALRLAQIELMAKHPHPFYWSAFALHGGW